VIRLEAGRFDDFFIAPFEAYGKGSPFVSVFRDDLERFLDAKRNPLLLRHGALDYRTAYRGDQVVGRITAHEHTTSNQLHGWRRGFFGYFDCADDLDAARALLEWAESWARARGLTELMGRFDLTAMQQIGIVTAGFDRAPYSDQVWTPPHLPRLLEACGYEPTFPMSSFEIDLAACDPEQLLGSKHRALLESAGLEWETLHKRRLDRELTEVCEVLNDGFTDNPMFVPLTEEEFRFQAKDLSLIIDERISVVAREKGRMVGCLICIPDLNPLLRATGSRFTWTTPFHFLSHRLHRRRAVAIFESVRREWHDRGLGGVLIHRVAKQLRESAYQSLGVTWVSDANAPSLAGVRRMGGREMHRLHLFRKALA
jgi:GNAT superfamily N-acetyltransferase